MRGKWRARDATSAARSVAPTFVGGISWSEAKQALFERIDAAIAPMVEPGQSRHRLVDRRLGQHEVLTVAVVEARGHVARHLDVLELIASDRHRMRLEHQDIGRHQHRVHE